MKNGLLILLMILMLTSCSSPDMYNGSPQDLMLELDDLPGVYTLMEDLSGDRPNEGLTMNSESPEAREIYVQRTGRVTGWENRFMLMEFTQTLPGFILNQVVVYESSNGAQTALGWPSAQVRETLEVDQEIGDTMIMTMMPFNAPDESPWIDYRVEFTYKNLLGAVSTYAPENVATPDFAIDLAKILYQSFQDQNFD
jgi:hypothetical protein